MRNWNLLAATAAIGVLVAAPAYAAEGGGPPTGMTLAPAKNNAKLTVMSTAIQNNGTIADTFTQNGQNESPQLTWTGGPAGTQSYVVLTEDTGVQRPQPIDHWVIYDIPGTVRMLPQNVAKDAKPSNPAGAMQGTNIAKQAGYVGPKPPAGQTHPYHFEVFALDTKLNLDPAKTDRTAVVNAMKGHVLASGELVGMYTGK